MPSKLFLLGEYIKNECGVTNFISDTVCESCFLGQYGNAISLSSCIPCASGMYADTRGLTAL